MAEREYKKTIIGIQGGRGSFNEEAILYYCQKNNIKDYEIRYLYTSENVMNTLQQGRIDRGQMAIHNSAGGIVDETIDALAKYQCRVAEKFAIQIAHALMIRNDAKLTDIDTIMTHPQVLAQCRQTLLKKYPHLKQISGEKEMIDHALVAKALSEKHLDKHIATMGSKVLTTLYNLRIIEDNLQDMQQNYTTFLHVVKRTD